MSDDTKNDPGVYQPTEDELRVASRLMQNYAEVTKAVMVVERNPLYNATLMALMNMLILLFIALRKNSPHQNMMVPKSMRHFAKRLQLLADAPDADAMERLAKDTSDLIRKH